jgi:hypothetical protein
MGKEDECCPKFDPKPWENKELQWKGKQFIKQDVRAFLHIPVCVGKTITGMWKQVQEAKAAPPKKDWLMLARDPSAWKTEWYLATTKDVPGACNVKLSGTFLTKVFEGPYKDGGKWYAAMLALAKKKGKEAKNVYFYYTTCPKCAKKYGKNYVVGFVEV